MKERGRQEEGMLSSVTGTMAEKCNNMLVSSWPSFTAGGGWLLSK